MGVISRTSTLDIIETLQQTVSAEETRYVRENYTQTQVSADVLAYMMDIVEATRRENNFVAGVSTRGAMALYKAAQVTALLNGRDYVIPEDVKYVAPFVLAHRISASGGLSADANRILSNILARIQVPLETV